jgi:tetratricopeptide (TPR) repeat protein
MGGGISPRVAEKCDKKPLGNMTNQFKNLVSSSGECHQVNPLTGFASNLSGAVEKIRIMGAHNLSQGVAAQSSGKSLNSIDAAEFEAIHGIAPQSDPQFSQWADGFAQRGIGAPGVAGAPLANTMMRPFMPGPFMFQQPPPQLASMTSARLFDQTAEARPAEPESVNDDLAAAKKMVEMLRNSGNPKFANCTFVDFIDQVAQGDLKIKDGQVIDRSGKAVDWDEVYGDQEASGGLGDLLEGTGDDAENLPDQMERIWNELRQDNEWLRDPSGGDYVFQHSDNPYIESSESPLDVALRLIAEGRDAEAIVALEAEVRLNENSSEGWRLLGQLHAQFDQDINAIKCLERGHACDPFNLDSMMALGVSLTNEFDSIKAMEILKKWIGSNEKYHHLLTEIPLEDDPLDMPDYDFSRLKRQVMGLFQKAATVDTTDPDIAVALGVLHNIDRNYAQAIDALLRAVELRPNDSTAWNKLGATMANSGLSKEALECYHQSLSLKPNYARAWSNLAIAHTNMEEYDNASRFFLAALQLSPDASHLWSSLTIALSNWQPENARLSDLLETKDIKSLVNMISGTPSVDSLPKPSSLSSDRAKALVASLRSRLL